MSDDNDERLLGDSVSMSPEILATCLDESCTFSVRALQSFQSLNFYKGGTRQNVKNCLLDSSK